MRKKCTSIGIILFILFSLVTLVPPHISAEKSVFGVSEELLQSLEQQKAFEQYMLENNYYFEMKFPFLLYDLLPIRLDQVHYSVTRDFNVSKAESILANRPPVTADLTGPKVGEYSLFQPGLMDLVLYQNKESDLLFKLDPSSANDVGDKYTIEAQSKVINGFKIFYGYDAGKSPAETDQQAPSTESKFLAQNAGVEFSLLPGVHLNADFKKSLKESGIDESQKHVNLAYNPGSFASFNAGLGVITTNGDFKSSTSAVISTGADLLPDQQRSNLEDIIIKELGLSLRPNMYSQLSADYIFVNEKGEPVSASKAKFAFRLGDHQKELNATYELANDENAVTRTSAGLELGLIDLASVRAVYSRGGLMSVGRLESTVDLGLNLSLARYSSFHFQYKLVLPELEPEEEQVAEAKLVLRF